MFAKIQLLFQSSKSNNRNEDVNHILIHLCFWGRGGLVFVHHVFLRFSILFQYKFRALLVGKLVLHQS